jgi:DNA-binding response OmpR family regulator
MARILIVDDDPDILELVSDALTLENFDVEAFDNAVNAKNTLRYGDFDLLIFDWNMPSLSGVDLCRAYRQGGGSSPVMMLTGKSDTKDKVEGLECGADDYLTKPFNVQELLARVRAHLRRADGKFVSGDSLRFGSITLDTAGHRVHKEDQEVKLLPKEFLILELFMRYPTRVFSADAILNRVWGSKESATPEVVRTYIKNIRKKLDLEDFIETVHSVGYRLKQ